MKSNRLLLLVLVVALVVRAGLFYVGRDRLQDDPDGYLRLAENFVATGTFGYRDVSDGSIPRGAIHPTAYRPPLYPLLLARCVMSGGSTLTAIGFAQLLFGVGTCVLVYLTARSIGLGPPHSAAAALFVVLDPILLHNSTLVMTETLATLLATLVLFVLVDGKDSISTPSTPRAALAGVFLGLAALCRPTFLVWLAVIGIGFLFLPGERRKRCLRCAACFLMAFLVLSPWIARNAMRFGHFIPATTHGGYTLFLANNPSFYNYVAKASWGETWKPDETFLREETRLGKMGARDELAADAEAYRLARQSIRQQPVRFLQASIVRIGRLWQLVPHRLDSDKKSSRRNFFRKAVGLWYAAMFFLAVLACWKLRRRLLRSPWIWGVLLCGSFTLVHAFYWSNMRMRAPLVPAIALLAAAGLPRRKDAKAGQGRAVGKGSDGETLS